MAKKEEVPEISPEETALEARVDDMMSLEKERSTAVSQLAEDFNKKLMNEGAVSGEVEIKQSAPELPTKLKKKVEKVEEEPKEPDILEVTNPSYAEPETPETKEEVKPIDAESKTEPEEDIPVSQEAKPADEFDDKATDQAVDDIMAEESDMLLSVQDTRIQRKKDAVTKPDTDWKEKFSNFLKSKWTWVGVGVIIVALFVVPATRYKILGLIIKKDVTVTVVDSKTSSPVSSANVELAGDSSKTDENGKAHLRAGLGSHTVTITKKYYTDLSQSYFVGFNSSQSSSVKLVATGRLVPITVTNRITGKPLAGVEIKAQGTSAKTNSKGKAELALPVKASTYEATLSLNGYNNTKVTVVVTDKVVKENSFILIPAGHVYFLSNLNGTLDVVKSNLDGSGRKVVLEGTGKEESSTTELSASNDWKYVVLKARRDTAQAAMYLIDTSSDKVTEFDTTNAAFNTIGWSGHNFVYDLTKNNASYWQTGRQIIKSYDADQQQLNQLDQSQGEGDSSAYGYQSFVDFNITDNLVSYITLWSGYRTDGSVYDLSGKNDVIRGILSNGHNKKDYQTFPVATVDYIQSALHTPQSVYFEFNDAVSGQTTHYELSNQSIKTASIDKTTFDGSGKTYFVSPSGKKSFWMEQRDGNDALFVGDNNAENQKQVASLNGYSPYGWFTDNYLLVSKSNSELYVIPSTQSQQSPLKIGNYYAPSPKYVP